MKKKTSWLRRLFTFKKLSHAKRYKRKTNIIFFLLFPAFLPFLWIMIQMDNSGTPGSSWIMIIYGAGLGVYVWLTNDQFEMIQSLEKTGPPEGYTRAQLRRAIKEVRTGNQQ